MRDFIFHTVTLWHNFIAIPFENLCHSVTVLSFKIGSFSLKIQVCVCRVGVYDFLEEVGMVIALSRGL